MNIVRANKCAENVKRSSAKTNTFLDSECSARFDTCVQIRAFSHRSNSMGAHYKYCAAILQSKVTCFTCTGEHTSYQTI